MTDGARREDPFSAKIEGYRGEELRELKRKAKYQVRGPARICLACEIVH